MTTLIRNIIISCLFLMCMTPFVKVQAQTLNFGNGIDGIPSIGPNTVVNSYKKILSVTGNTFTLVNNTSFTLLPYNKVLVINMLTGNYELRQVVSVNGLNVELSVGNVSNSLFSINSQIIKVPQFSNVTITAGNSITSPVWNGDTGGVICFLVSQTLNLEGGSIDASGRGFFGGPGGPGGIGGTGGPGGFSGANTSPNGGLSGYGGSGAGGAGWGGDIGYPGTSGASGSAAFYGANPFWPIYGLPCGSTISSCNATNSSTSLLFMGDGGAGGNGGNGKSGAGGGGSKCNQLGINGGPGGNGGAGGLGGRGGGIIYIIANNVNHTSTIMNCAGSSGLAGLPGTGGGNGGNGTCQGGGGNGADGGDGGGGGHSGAGGTVKISKFSGSITTSLVNINGGASVAGGTGGSGGIGGIQNGNNTGNCSCGTFLPCSFSNLIPFLASPYTNYSIDLQGTSHFIFTYGDSTLNLSYSDLTSCGGYFLAELTGTLYENGIAITYYVAQIASMNNNILSSLIDFVNNNTPNLDLSGSTITTANYTLINGCGICAQCVSTLAQNGDPGNSGPTGTQGGNGYFSEDCIPAISSQQMSFCGNGYLTVNTPGNPANYSFQWTIINGIMGGISPNLNNCMVTNYMNNCGGTPAFAQISCAVTSLTGGCSWTQTFDVQLLPDPSSCFNINSVSNICEGEVIPPLIVSQLGPPTGCSLTYQWYVNNVMIPGATASSYQPPSNLPEGIYNYSVYCVLNNCWNTCSNFFDLNEQVVIWSQPEINAGIDTIVCSGAIVQLSGTITNGPIVPSSGGVVSGVWSTSGDGTFGNLNSLTTTYTPGLQDIINGSVSITLTSTAPYWNWPCSQVSDSFILTIVTPPVLNAGLDQVICPNQVVSINGSITGNASNLYWIGGTGLYSPNSNSLNINYTPSSSEINTGGFTLVLMANTAICGIISDEITITVNSSPIITNISASNCDFYEWNGITYTESGQYQYQGTSINGCDSIVNLNLTILKSFELSSNVTNCGPYTWPVNNQTYTQSGIYNFQALTIAGCDSTIILNLTIYDDLVEPIIDISNTVELSSMTQSNVSYQWVVCPDYTPIANATSNNYTATNTGEYALIVSNLCGSDTSDCVQVSISGISESEQYSLLVYPNPVWNEFYIDYAGEIRKFEILDFNGKIILQSDSPAKSNLIPASISDGIYFLKVYTPDRIIGEKLIIKKR
jgi:hypothetical protein